MAQQQLSPIGPGFQLNDSEHEFTPSWNGIPVVEIKPDGIFAPLLLERMGRDPAVSSSIFVTFLTDFTGFFAVLLIASFLFA